MAKAKFQVTMNVKQLREVVEALTTASADLYELLRRLRSRLVDIERDLDIEEAPDGP